MLQGFKEFIMRGNVMELAVAVVMGSAFTNIVTAFTKGLINPLIAALGADPQVGLGIPLREGVPAATLDFGSVITAALNFLIIAAVIYFIMIMPMNKLAEIQARRKGITPEEAAQTETELLAEIRDLLAQDRSRAGTAATTALNNDIDPNGAGRHTAQ